MRHLTMSGKTILITGASSGIGFEAAMQLAALGAQMILIAREPERGRLALEAVTAKSEGLPPSLLIADLSSQASIRSLADQVHGRFRRLDVLINDAGAVFSRREFTVDGIERSFAVNHLAPFLLTLLLFDLVRRAPAGRIVNVSSEIHSGSLDFENLQGEKRYNFLEAYYQSKLENVLFTYELARRIRSTGLTVNALSPGPTRTRFGDNLQGFPRLFPLMMKNLPFLFVPPSVGARTSVFLASSPDVAGVSGRFFLRGREILSKPISYDEGVARRLWEVSEKLTSATLDLTSPALSFVQTSQYSLEALSK